MSTTWPPRCASAALSSELILLVRRRQLTGEGLLRGTSVGATNGVALLDAAQVGNEAWRRNDRLSVQRPTAVASLPMRVAPHTQHT